MDNNEHDYYYRLPLTLIINSDVNNQPLKLIMGPPFVALELCFEGVTMGFIKGPTHPYLSMMRASLYQQSI